MPGRRHAPHGGFTLLELLVVMFIIGIVAAMATLSIGTATSQTGIEQVAAQLADRLTLVREEAVMQGREFGLRFFARQYEFTVYDFDQGRWQPVAPDAGLLQAQKLPGEAVLELRVDGRDVALPEERPVVEAEQETRDKAMQRAGDGRPADPARGRDAPQVLILSSGDVTPFAVHLRPAIGSPGVRLEVADDGSTQTVRDEF